MYTRILAAVDDSRESRRALDQAVMLSKVAEAQLRLVCVVDEYSFDASQWATPSSHALSVEQKLASARGILEEAQRLAGDSGVEAQTELVAIGAPPKSVSEAILETAVSWSADLIVLGTHGRKGLDRIVLGSVAEGVARSAPAPVLLVRDANPSSVGSRT